MKNSIAYYRFMNKLTQEDLAKKIGISKNSISNIERGYFNPSLITAIKISLVFDVPITSLFDFNSVDLNTDEFNLLQCSLDLS